MPNTQEILDHHLSSFGQGDLSAILSDYASDAVLFTPAETLKGVEALKPFFTGLFAEFGQPGTTFEMKHVSVEGDVAYIVWTAATSANIYEIATDTFVVRDGKITAQSFAGKITPRS